MSIFHIDELSLYFSVSRNNATGCYKKRSGGSIFTDEAEIFIVLYNKRNKPTLIGHQNPAILKTRLVILARAKNGKFKTRLPGQYVGS